MPLNSFSVSTMVSSSCLVIFLLCFVPFSAEECQWNIVLSNDWLKCRTVRIHLNLLRVVMIGQDNIFGDCCLHAVGCSLMYIVPMPWLLFGLVSLCSLGAHTLQPSLWVGTAFHYILSRDLCSTGPCPGIYRVVLHSVAVWAQGWSLSSLTRLDAIPGKYTTQIFYFCGTEWAFLCISLQSCALKPDEYLPQFPEVIIQTALCEV